MWPFKQHVDSLLESGMMSGLTDWHSHILPGVDDGFKTIEDSIAALRRYEKMGVKRVWLTPHVMEDYANETGALQKRYEELCLEWDGDVELKLASENMLDSLFESRLEQNDFLPLGEEGNHLLVETSYFNPPMNMDELLEKIFKTGYYPMLAHPERYRYMEFSDYEKYKEMGVKFQINFMSLVGGYGETAMKKCEWLLKKGYVDIIGSDLHRIGVIDKVMGSSPRKKEHLQKLLEIAGNPTIK